MHRFWNFLQFSVGLLFVFSSNSGFGLEIEYLGTQDLKSLEISRQTIGFGENYKPNYDIRFYKLIYKTLDEKETQHTATALLALPVLNGKYPVISYQHGTLVERSEAPSKGRFNVDSLAARLIASQGYIVIAPDLLGLGDSSKIFHPYLHAKTEAKTSFDILSQLKDHWPIMISSDPNWENLFLMGYSQGGHTTLALQSWIETHTDWKIRGSVPMSGPYSLTKASLKLSEKPKDRSPFAFVSYAIVTLNRIYKIFDDYSDIFLPTKTDIPNLFDGFTSFANILEKLPDQFNELLTENFILRLKNLSTSDPLYNALLENDVYRFKAKSPILFIHGNGDVTVPVENMYIAADYLKQYGAKVETMELGLEADHSTSVIPAFEKAFLWIKSQIQ